MKILTRMLMECDLAAGLPAGLKLVAVLEADDGITVGELTRLLNCGRTAAKHYIKAAAERGWLAKTAVLRDTCSIYQRTDRGEQLTTRLIC